MSITKAPIRAKTKTQLPVAAVSVFAGVRLVKWLPERLFFQLVTWALLIVSIKLAYDGAAGVIAA